MFAFTRVIRHCQNTFLKKIQSFSRFKSASFQSRSCAARHHKADELSGWNMDLLTSYFKSPCSAPLDEHEALPGLYSADGLKHCGVDDWATSHTGVLVGAARARPIARCIEAPRPAVHHVVVLMYTGTFGPVAFS